MNKTTDQDLIAAKTRDVNAAADLKELKLRILRGEYIRASDVEKKQADEISRVRTKLLAVPSKLARRLSGQAFTAQEVNDVLTEAMNEALNELSRHEL